MTSAEHARRLWGMDDTDETTTGPKIKIGTRLRELAAALGLNQRQLALRVGIDPRHFNSFWLDRRAASFETVIRVAQHTGRSVAWVCGEEAARPQLGTVNRHGQVMIDVDQISAGVLYFAEASGPFAAGTRLFVDPTDAFVLGRWLLVRSHNGGEAWLAWSHEENGLALLHRPDGEILRYAAERHEVIGIVAGMLVAAPGPLSAQR